MPDSDLPRFTSHPTDVELAVFRDRCLIEGPLDPTNPAAYLVPTDVEAVPVLADMLGRGTSGTFRLFLSATLACNHVRWRLGRPSLAAEKAAGGDG